MSKNFWPSEIGTQKMVVPKTMLVEQANFFNEMTKNRLVAKVNTRRVSSRMDGFVHEFDIVVPTLGNYTFTLFSVKHDLGIYPLEIDFDLAGTEYPKVGEKEFESTLKEILTSKKTIDTINGLMAQL